LFSSHLAGIKKSACHSQQLNKEQIVYGSCFFAISIGHNHKLFANEEQTLQRVKFYHCAD
jgi:hypothetical protein